MPLQILSAHASQAGVREKNEDFVGIVIPVNREMDTKGAIAAVADGVSGSEGGREAAEYAVRGLLTDYYATPETWQVAQSLDKLLTATNRWIQAQSGSQSQRQGMATTLTSVVLRGRNYYFAHVGDTRLYLFRQGKLIKLTTDHVWDRPEMQHVLTRAIGLDSKLSVDHGLGDLYVNDIFLLISDGIWAKLSNYDLESALDKLLQGHLTVEQTAQQLVQEALTAGSADNASAIVLQITALPESSLADTFSEQKELPVPPHFKVGDSVDGMTVEAIIHDSRITRLYRVQDPATQRQLVLKTLQPDLAKDAQERLAFAHEEWIAKRITARFFPQVISREYKSSLYYLTTWHEGTTLEQRSEDGYHYTVPEIIKLATLLARAVGALHRRSVIHRDIKPANLHWGKDEELRVLDFGIAQSGLQNDLLERTHQAGTPSFLAPEQFEGTAASRQSDIYAVGVTLYWLLTRHYPYGEIEPFQKPRFGDPTPPSRYRPDLPAWLEGILLKALAELPENRFETAEEMLLALERGPMAGIKPVATPLVSRNPMLMWQGIALSSIVINLLLIFLLLATH
ncbi:protein kinase domain-containing protein [Ampullimonas aquatilis]|uniref:protein kinase domain-containing protein n=1 Tax=Ampullimonas aquatilis TaxID=1341549 RepID=UPI003C76D154